MKRILVFLLLLSSNLCLSQVFEVETIKSAGPNNERINFVILPDGYTEEEFSKFESDSERLVTQIFNTGFFQAYADFINVHIIKVPSKDSGAIHPGTASDEPGNVPTQTVDNYFGSSFDVSGIHRLLVPTKGNRIISVLADNFPTYSQAIVLVNTPYYGGSGGTFATLSATADAAEIAIHELGHSFARLADEYELSTPITPRESPNATAITTRENIRWKAWIKESTPLPTPETGFYADEVGIFEGAMYTSVGWYRPKIDCKMRSLGQPFCEVCAETFVLRFYDFVNPLKKLSPSYEQYTVSGEENIVFEADVLGGDKINFNYQWIVNGEIVDVETDFLSVDFDDSSNDSNLISLIITDASGFLRSDTISFTTQWQINGNLSNLKFPALIDGFEPLIGSSGESIRINGVNFARSGDDIEVKVNDVPLEILNIDNNQITVQVPDDKLNGPIVLSIDGEEIISAIEFKTRAVIDDFNPKQAQVGDTIRVTGTNFSGDTNENLYGFGGATAVPYETNSTTASVIIPEEAKTARVKLTVNDIQVSSSDFLEIRVVTSVNGDYENEQIRVFPNPSNGNLRIAIPARFMKPGLKLNFYNLNGELVLSTSPDSESDIGISSLSPGVYLLKLVSSEVLFTEKIIVK